MLGREEDNYFCFNSSFEVILEQLREDIESVVGDTHLEPKAGLEVKEKKKNGSVIQTHTEV